MGREARAEAPCGAGRGRSGGSQGREALGAAQQRQPQPVLLKRGRAGGVGPDMPTGLPDAGGQPRRSGLARVDVHTRKSAD